MEHDQLNLEELLATFPMKHPSPNERRMLYSAALSDQRIFDPLCEDALIVEALDDPEFRKDVIRKLSESDSTRQMFDWFGMSGWFGQPALFVPVAGLAILLVAISLGTEFKFPTPMKSPNEFVSIGAVVDSKGLAGPPGSATSSLTAKAASAIVDRYGERSAHGLALRVDSADSASPLTTGGDLRIEFKVPRDAMVLLVAANPSGDLAVLFPNRRHPSAWVPKGAMVVVRDPTGNLLEVPSRPGRHRLTLLAFSPDADLNNLGTHEEPLKAEAEFEVVP